MAGATRNWNNPLALAALLLCVAAAFAQSPPGALTGRLTDLHSKPVEGATVIVRNEAGGAELRTTTGKNGVYRFAVLSPGLYTIEAASAPLGRGRLEGIAIAAGGEARLQTAMEFTTVPVPETPEKAVQPVPERLPPIWPPSGPALSTQAIQIEAFVPVEPLEELRMVGHTPPEPLKVVSGRWSVVSETVSAQVEVTLPAIPFETLPLPGRDVGKEPTELTRTESVPSLQPSSPSAQQVASPRAGPAAQAVTTTLSGEELQALPSSGRRWQDFLPETPAAVSNAGGEGAASLRGSGQEPASPTLDGSSRELVFGQGGPALKDSAAGQTGAVGRGLAIGEVAIRAVQTVAGNVAAEDRRGASGRVNVETESGSNGWHGQGFVFDKQSAWGAQNPFSQWVQETAPAAGANSANPIPTFTGEPYTPTDREITWGAGAGSRIRRDKLFWFAALDGYRRNDPGVATVKHPDLFFAQPSNDQMQVLSARLGSSSVNPVAEGLTSYSCLLETLGGALGGSSSDCLTNQPFPPLLGPAPRNAAQDTGFARIDWQAAERHRLTLEAIGARWNSPGGGLTRSSEAYGNHSFGSSQASEEWLLGRWEAFLTPNLLAVTQASAGRTLLKAPPETPSVYEKSFLHVNQWGQLPQIVVDNRYGFTIGNPARFGPGSFPDEHLFQMQEQVDWVRGTLLVKSGFEVQHTADATSLLRNRTGTYTYANVENFASDALVFAAFGISPAPNPLIQPYCDQTGKAWRDASGGLHGMGSLPCYSYYSQMLGPTDWSVSTNDWASYATAQWQPLKQLVVSAGLRWEREQMPPPIAALWPPPLATLPNSNPSSPKALPSLGNQWGPRVGLAWGLAEGHWPVLRLGYGMYFGRTENSTIEAILTQTGSPNGDLYYFLRPTDNLNGGGAPPFPAVLTGEPGSVVKPGAVELAANFRNPEIHQATAAVEERLPGGIEVTASALLSLGRRLPVSIDTNLDPAVNPKAITFAVVDGSGLGPIKSSSSPIKVPFYASWPFADCPSGSAQNAAGQCGRLNSGFQQIDQLMSRANSTWEAAMVKVERSSRKGLSLHAHYTYSHAMDWNPSEGGQATGSSVLDPEHFNLEYGTGDLDVRHAVAGMVIWEAPWKLHGWAARLGNGWMLSTIGQFRSGLPYTMRVSGSLPKTFDTATGAAIVGLGPGINGLGGDNRIYWETGDGQIESIGRNTYRYPSTWKADLRLGRRFDLGKMRELELLAESFNLFNHQNVTELETTGYFIQSGSPPSTLGTAGSLPTLNFMTGLKAGATAFGQPLNVNATNFFHPRQIQFGLRMRF